MSVLSPGPGEVFRVTSRKSLSNNPNATWVNTYEIAANSTGLPEGTFTGIGDLQNAALAIQEWERSLHLTDVLFDRLTISTWLSDSVPYNGDEFAVVTNVVSGTRLASGDPLGLENCLFIERQPLAGRTGKIYLRRCLGEGDITAPAGRTSLNNPLREALNESFVDPGGPANLIDQLAAAADALLVMAAINSSSVPVIRRVFAISASDRVTQKKTDNRWFNRSS